jgi:hypothetical protein
MEFSQKKLPIDCIQKLYRVRVDAIQPYALMLAPVYLFLKANEKFVACKAPLDFFTEAELFRLKDSKYFYLPEFVTSVLPVRESGEQVRTRLTWSPAETLKDGGVEYPDVALPPAPYELSDYIIRRIGLLWWKYPNGIGIEPFLVTVFVNELCDLLPSEKLLLARENDVENYDLALYRSSWIVFLALHLGYCDLEFLNELRLRVFEENIAQRFQSRSSSEIDEIISLGYASLESSHQKIIKFDYFTKKEDKISQKIDDRITNVVKKYLSKGSKPPSIYGKRGFIHV